MGIKNFIKKILSSKKEPENKLTKDKKEKIIRVVKNNEDGSKSIKLKQQGGKEVSLNINVSFGGKIDKEKDNSRVYDGGKNEYGSYSFTEIDSSGNETRGSTSESPAKYKRRKALEMVDEEASKITIKFEGKEYNSEQLIELYNQHSDGYIPRNELPDITNKQYLNPNEIDEIKKIKSKEEAKKWKSKLRSLRRKGKLEQYKIDMLNKLGMIWHPNGYTSKDDWEKKYISFRKNGLCVEIKDWVKEQRIEFENKTISNENLLRLQAVDFPFKAKDNEHYKLTKQSCWDLREKLDNKINRFKVKRQKELSVYEKKKSWYGTKKQLEKLKKSRKEVNSFYNRKYSFCSPLSLKKLNEKEALKKLSDIDKGISYSNTRLKEFLDNETKKYKENKKRIPQYFKEFYNEVNNTKLSQNQIYLELSQFNQSTFNGVIRKQACHYMLKNLPHISLKSGKLFKEINYLISTYKKEKNRTELIYLKDYIEKYPMLNEFYGEKINVTILKLKP